MSILPTHNGQRAYTALDKYDGESRFDVIVIGSGMGGMSCAASLARTGKKVLLLEQHYIPGGYTHMFARKGFHWDAGIHAIGEMRPGKVPYEVLDWMGRGQVKWESLGDPFDVFWFSDGFKWGLPSTRKAYFDQLYEHFPEQSDALDRYFQQVREATKGALYFLGGKSLGKALSSTVQSIVNRKGREFWSKTTSEVMDECGITGKLRTILTLHWGYYGSIPDESCFSLHALTHAHFWNGAYYPVGGSKSIASALLGTIIDAGGKILTKASVSELVLDGKRATGVRTQEGRKFHASIVVSAAGAKNTVNSILPEPWKSSDWAEKIRSVGSSPPYICMNIGFEGDIAKAGATKSNLWLMDTWENNQTHWDMEKDEDPHILYCSFPSLKDPEYDPGRKQKHTGEAITFLDWSVFKKWEASMHGQREDEYEALKKKIEDRILRCLRKNLPELMDLMVHHELSTPITAHHFVRADQGAIYGLEATPERFGTEELRTRTPIKRFYMAGGDVASLGVVGAMMSGVLAAASIDWRIYKRLIG